MLETEDCPEGSRDWSPAKGKADWNFVRKFSLCWIFAQVSTAERRIPAEEQYVCPGAPVGSLCALANDASRQIFHYKVRIFICHILLLLSHARRETPVMETQLHFILLRAPGRSSSHLLHTCVDKTLYHCNNMTV